MLLPGLLLVMSISGQAHKAPAPGSLSAPLVADPSPTAWSCTVETLSSGKDCVFESEAAPSSALSAQEAQNVRFVKELAPQACAKAARTGGKADKVLVGMCQREFAAVAETCGLAGEAPLVDAKGRFAPAARACYVTLAEVLQRAAFTAATTTQCCQCLAASCKVAPDRCYRDLSRATPDKAEQACVANACAQECSGVATRASDSQFTPSSPPQAAQHGTHEL